MEAERFASGVSCHCGTDGGEEMTDLMSSIEGCSLPARLRTRKWIKGVEGQDPNILARVLRDELLETAILGTDTEK